MTGGALSCPRCRVDLFQGQAAGVTMLGCGICGGVWLDNASAQRVQSVAPEEAVGLADRAAAYATGDVDVRAAIACPVCGKPMARTPVQAAHVDVDTCSAHGTWFDKNELHAVADAFAAIRQRRGKGMAYAGVGAAAVGVAAVGVAGAAVLASQDPAMQSRAQSAAAGASDVAASFGSAAADVAGTVAEVAVDVAGSGLLEGAGELAVSAVGLIFSIFD